MKLFSLSRSVGKGIRMISLLAILLLSLGPAGTGVAYAEDPPPPPTHDSFSTPKVITGIEYHDIDVNTQGATPSDTVPNTNDPNNFNCEGETFNYGFP